MKFFYLTCLLFLSVTIAKSQTFSNGTTGCAAESGGLLYTDISPYNYPNGVPINTTDGYWVKGSICNPIIYDGWFNSRSSGGILIGYFFIPLYKDGYTYTYVKLPLDDYVPFLGLVMGIISLVLLKRTVIT